MSAVLGVDPAPGDVEAVERLAARLAEVRRELSSAGGRLLALRPGAGQWEGEAARAFGEQVEGLVPLVERARDAHGRAERALRGWAAELEQRQAAARRLQAEAEQAVERVRQARLSASAARERAAGAAAWTLSPEALADAERAAAAARSRLAVAEDDLALLRRRARALRAEHEDAAARVAAQVRAAAEAAPDAPGLLGRLRDLGASAVDLAEQHAHAVAEVADVLGEVSGLLGLGALGLGLLGVATGPVGWAALVLAAGAAAGHGAADLLGAEVDGRTHVLNTLAVATGGLSQGAGGLVRGLTAQGLVARPVVRGRHAAPGLLGGRGRHAAPPPPGAALGRAADVVGAAGTAYGAWAGRSAPGDDRSYGHFSPDDAAERRLRAVGGPVLLAFGSAVRHGHEQDGRARCTR